MVYTFLFFSMGETNAFGFTKGHAILQPIQKREDDLRIMRTERAKVLAKRLIGLFVKKHVSGAHSFPFGCKAKILFLAVSGAYVGFYQPFGGQLGMELCDCAFGDAQAIAHIAHVCVRKRLHCAKKSSLRMVEEVLPILAWQALVFFQQMDHIKQPAADLAIHENPSLLQRCFACTGNPSACTLQLYCEPVWLSILFRN
ncbi:MAG: hypothetical protein VB087_11505 [Candidatus Limiplasma sp.]|nr:hypothetical protein [Candidatus Limiplasma sp.]